MKKMFQGSLKAVLTLLVCAITIGATMVYANAAGAGTGGSKKMNVVFVIDESGSMGNTDRDKFRYEAVEAFMALSAESGNYMGAISFDDSIIERIDICQVTDKTVKEAIAKRIKSVPKGKDTNIGQALKLATDMIINQGNSNLDSAIIILSDGKTDLPQNPKGLTKAEQDRQDAIEAAKKYDIDIYSVCLNQNGAAIQSEIQEASDATVTDGFREVRNAEDLTSVFNMFYEMIYGTETIRIADTIIPEGGKLVVPFTIPSVGVEEANVTINRSNYRKKLDYGLTKPDGTELSKSEVDSMLYDTNTYSVIKIDKPEGGEWNLVISGDEGARVQVNMIYNSDLSLTLSDVGAGKIMLNNPIPLSVEVMSNGAVVTDQSMLEANPVHIAVTSAKTGKTDEYEIPNGGLEYDITFADYDDYTVVAYMEIDGMVTYSNELTYSIGNTIPEAEDCEITKFITPFSKPIEVDLSEYAVDVEDRHLEYKIGHTDDIDKSDIDLDDEILTLDIANIKDGYITIIAEDSKGATVEFQVIVNTINLLLIFGIIAAVLLIILILIIVISNAKKNAKVIPGTIKLICISDGVTSAPQTIDGHKGQHILNRDFEINMDTGINGLSYFTAGKKSSYIMFVSKKGYITDFSDTPSKKIRLDSFNEVTIYGNQEMTRGIRVTYKSMDDFSSF